MVKTEKELNFTYFTYTKFHFESTKKHLKNAVAVTGAEIWKY